MEKLLNSEQRIEAMHRRAMEIEKNRRIVRARVAGAAAVCASVLLIIAAAFNIPQIINNGAGGETTEFTGSLFSNTPVLGIIVIGILAFVLGTLVTILCFRLRSWIKDASPEDGN